MESGNIGFISKQSFSSCQFSKQKWGLFFCFLKRQVQKIVPGMNLRLTPYNHSTFMWLSPQEDFKPTPIAAPSHPQFWDCLNSPDALQGAEVPPLQLHVLKSQYATEHHNAIDCCRCTRKFQGQSSNLHNFPAASLSDLTIALCVL